MTMSESSSKQREEEENNGEGTDRISSLPDSVLCHILSFLPTRTCVATMSLVSRRWRHLWQHLQAFDFYDDYNKFNTDQSERFEDFAVFVNAVLTLRRSRDIRKMRLACGHSRVDKFSANSVNTWIRAAIGPHLEVLHLALFSTDEYDFRLPLTILTCPNLVSLSLCGEDILVQLERTTAVRLPSLKTLRLDIGYVDANSVDILLSACPILETLELSFSPASLTRLRMPPSLKRLKFIAEKKISVFLEIDAPGLKYLSLTLTRVTFDAVGDLHNVEEAYLDVFSAGESESVDPLLNLLRALSGTKRLVLRRPTIKWLFAVDWLFGALDIDFPEFCYLLYLELILPSFNSSFLFKVLQKCPLLRSLIIKNDKDRSSPRYRRAGHPESVPNCLVSHLTFIHFKGYEGFLDELEFAGYVLRNGLVLKTMRIAGLSLDRKEKWEKYRFLKMFSDIPRGSAVCQLKFY